jgi:hypothetical protein
VSVGFAGHATVNGYVADGNAMSQSAQLSGLAIVRCTFRSTEEWGRSGAGCSSMRTTRRRRWAKFELDQAGAAGGYVLPGGIYHDLVAADRDIRHPQM